MVQLSLSPYVRLSHDFHTPVNMALGPCWINDHGLHYFQSGVGFYEVGGRRYLIEPGRAFLVRPGEVFAFCAAPGTSFHMLNIHFDAVERADSKALRWPYPSAGEVREFTPQERLDTSLSAPRYLPYDVFIPDPVHYEWLFRRVQGFFDLHDFASSLQLKGAMLELLAFLFRAEAQKKGAVSGRHEAAMQAALQYVQSHCHGPIHLRDIAAAVSLSETHFAALFRSRFGVAPMKMVTHLRMGKAKMELGLGDAPIKQIAHMVGYDSVHHFSRVFKQEAGLPPALFRRLYAPATLKDKNVIVQ